MQKDTFSINQYEQLKNDFGFIIAYEIIRFKGNLGNTSLPFKTKHPTFSSRYGFAKMCVIRYHELVFHNGLKETINETKTK